jgi:hypothetical protein
MHSGVHCQRDHEAAFQGGIHMINRRPATEHEVVLAFLRADMGSPHVRQDYVQASDHLGHDETWFSHLVDDANLEDGKTNSDRRELLMTAHSGIFKGFPEDVRWEHVELEPFELKEVRYLRYNPWCSWTNGSLLVADGAKRIATNQDQDCVSRSIRNVAALIRTDKTFPELVGVEVADGHLRLLDGHKRATAYALAGYDKPVPAFIGKSPNLIDWTWY